MDTVHCLGLTECPRKRIVPAKMERHPEPAERDNCPNCGFLLDLPPPAQPDGDPVMVYDADNATAATIDDVVHSLLLSGDLVEIETEE